MHFMFTTTSLPMTSYPALPESILCPQDFIPPVSQHVNTATMYCACGNHTTPYQFCTGFLSCGWNQSWQPAQSSALILRSHYPGWTRCFLHASIALLIFSPTTRLSESRSRSIFCRCSEDALSKTMSSSNLTWLKHFPFICNFAFLNTPSRQTVNNFGEMYLPFWLGRVFLVKDYILLMHSSYMSSQSLKVLPVLVVVSTVSDVFFIIFNPWHIPLALLLCFSSAILFAHFIYKFKCINDNKIRIEQERKSYTYCLGAAYLQFFFTERV